MSRLRLLPPLLSLSLGRRFVCVCIAIETLALLAVAAERAGVQTLSRSINLHLFARLGRAR